MGTDTKIQWTDATFNPWRGCTKVSSGCSHCYAETMSKRNPKILGVWGDAGTRVVASEAKWQEPLKWNAEAKAAGERRRVFCASLADVFEDREELDIPRLRMLALIARTPNLDWLLLTKRPENYARLMGRALACVPGYCDAYDDTIILGTEWLLGRPPKNIWIGVSVENQAAADSRIPHLLNIPAAVRFLSVEPMLGPVGFTRHWYTTHNWHNWLTGDTGLGRTTNNFGSHHQTGQKIDWIIFSGESGPGARPCNIEWIRDGVRQCRRAGVKAFVKQLGSKPFQHELMPGLRMGGYLHPTDSKGGDMEEWPEDLRIREFPNAKEVAGG